eukprot:s34_g4.t1
MITDDLVVRWIRLESRSTWVAEPPTRTDLAGGHCVQFDVYIISASPLRHGTFLTVGGKEPATAHSSHGSHLDLLTA